MNTSILNLVAQFNLQNTPKDVYFDDNTDYVGNGIANTQVLGLIKAYTPSQVFHNNTDWANPDIKFISQFPLVSYDVANKYLYITGNYVTEFTSGQTYTYIDNINYFVTNPFSFAVVTAVYDAATNRTKITTLGAIPNNLSIVAGVLKVQGFRAVITLPLDVNGNVVKTLYSFEYTVRILNESFSLPILRKMTGNAGIVVSGNLVGKVLTGDSILIAGVNFIAGIVSYNGSTNETSITASVGALSVVGQNLVYYKTTDYTYTKTYNYCFTEPTIHLDMSANCDTSTLTSKDVTDYGSYLTTITRVHTVKYPDTMLTPIPDVVSSLKEVTVSPIYTRVWSTVLVSTLKYTYPDGLVINCVVRGADDIFVDCVNCLCTMYNCIKALELAYIDAVGNNANPAMAKKLKLDWDYVMSEWMLLMIAKQCGNTGEVTLHCTNITNTISNNQVTCGCVSNTVSDAMSVLVTPIISGGGNTYVVNGGSHFFGIGVPASNLGVDDDIYFDTQNHNVYKKISGVWELQFNWCCGSSSSLYPSSLISKNIGTGGTINTCDKMSDIISQTTTANKPTVQTSTGLLATAKQNPQVVLALLA